MIIFVLAVGLGWVGGIPLAIVLAVCSLIGYYEMTRALQVHGAYRAPDDGVNKEGGIDRKMNLLEIVGLVAAILYWLILIAMSAREVGLVDTTFPGPSVTNPGIDIFIANANALTLVTIILVFLLEMAIYVLTFPRYDTRQVVGAVISFLYVPVLIACIYRSRFVPAGKFVYALIFFCSWICDTGAWFFGRLFGRHKMAPILSPKKTIEGAIGGVACGTFLCFLAGVLAEHIDRELHLIFAFTVIGVFGCLLGMVGDLAASAIKRNHDIKDYGDVIPGHGGIMDRFDSIIFTAPVIYYLAVLFLTVLR